MPVGLRLLFFCETLKNNWAALIHYRLSLFEGDHLNNDIMLDLALFSTLFI